MGKRGLLFLILNELRFSYWFVPAVMALGAVLLSIATVSVDNYVGASWFDEAGWLYSNRPDGARALLSTIAGSMITVAGVTFSITVAAVASSTNQFGPRLLTNFLSDRGNQITLGTFIATFLYCVLILRTVISAGEADKAFVPNLAVHVALVLALASVAVLIFFLHHVPQSVHVSQMIAKVGHELIAEVDKLFPQRIGDPAADTSNDIEIEPLVERIADGHTVPAKGYGYVQQIDGEHLLDVASEHDLVIKIECRPGAFVRRGRPLARLLAAEPPDDALQDRICAAFTWHDKRSPTQDIMFLIDQLVEVAARALSPGMNDPFTAINCLEWLTTALAEVADRHMPDACRMDDAGELRIIARPIDFAEITEAAYGALRPYVARDRNAAMHAMAKLASLAEGLRTTEQKAIVRAQATAYLVACEKVLEHTADKLEIARLFAITKRHCEAPLAE